VEESKFCLFSVVFPLRCISSISPRFYFRRHTFCFLPLVAILESPRAHFLRVLCIEDLHWRCVVITVGWPRGVDLGSIFSIGAMANTWVLST
jgi:hypothetical protein